jgi:hypothetical protein
VVCVFARKTSEPLTSLVKQIDQKIGEDNRLKAFVVLLADDADQGAKDLEKLAKDAGIQNVPLTVFDGTGGPEHYQVAREADVTALMWRNSKVEANHAYKGELAEADVRKIVADIPKILGN